MSSCYPLKSQLQCYISWVKEGLGQIFTETPWPCCFRTFLFNSHWGDRGNTYRSGVIKFRERASPAYHWRISSSSFCITCGHKTSFIISTGGNYHYSAIWGFNPLILPKPALGISRVSSSKALEAILPNLVVINPKTFSMAPNLQTQEGVIICMPKPFPYEDSHRVPWKYNMSLISTRTGKEKVYPNISSGLSGLTMSSHCYTLEEL